MNQSGNQSGDARGDVAEQGVQDAVEHHRHDPGWPELPAGEHAVTELSAARSGALSPFGETLQLPVPAEDLPYVHPITVPNR